MKKTLKIAWFAAAVSFFAAASAQPVVRYGNNLGLTPAAEYASQFRYASDAELQEAKLSPETAFKPGAAVEWSVEPLFNLKYVKINPKTGVLSFPKGCYRANSYGIAMVTAKAGKDVVKTPVFFNFPATGKISEKHDFGYQVTYTPFVLTVNPEKGGKGAPAVVEGEDFDPANFSLEYRRMFNFINFAGPESHHALLKAQDADQSKLLYQIWDAYFEATGKPVNYGSKYPASYFSNQRKLDLPAAYVDNADGCRVVVNPGKWRDNDGVWANGAFIGEMTYVNMPEGVGVNEGQTTTPIIIWFDGKF